MKKIILMVAMISATAFAGQSAGSAGGTVGSDHITTDCGLVTGFATAVEALIGTTFEGDNQAAAAASVHSTKQEMANLLVLQGQHLASRIHDKDTKLRFESAMSDFGIEMSSGPTTAQYFEVWSSAVSQQNEVINHLYKDLSSLAVATCK